MSRVPLLSVLILLFTANLAQSAYTYTTVDYPGATSTAVTGINDSGTIVGIYVMGGVAHGFQLSEGTLTTIDFPGATITRVYGINNGGAIVGQYVGGGMNHGFVLNEGSFLTLDVPGATWNQASGINDDDTIVGAYCTASLPNPCEGSGATHGFLRSNGEFTTIDVSGAIATDAFRINDMGHIVGFYENADLTTHGFQMVTGNVVTIDGPGATSTSALGINDGGALVGQFETSGSLTFAYLLLQGTFVPVNPCSCARSAFEINNSGQIVGLYVDAGGQHGFLATPGTTDAIADVILQVESLGLNAGIGDALTRTLRNAQASPPPIN
jgi:hypothetical protein